MKYFMLDIETCGTNPEVDDIIQIGLLECIPTLDGYAPGQSYCRTLHTSQKPNDFIKHMHRELLTVSAKCPMIEPSKVRNEILNYFKQCGVTELAGLMGLNATTFDVPFMVQKGFLKKPYQVGSKLYGDYHYRIYELKGAFNLAQDVLGVDSKKLFELAAKHCPEIIPLGKPHEVLYDCYNQLKTLNGVIRLLRSETPLADPRIQML